MKAVLQALVRHLRDNQSRIVRDVDVVVEVYDPTFGLSTKTETLSVIDFDNLLYQIDEFAETFKS